MIQLLATSLLLASIYLANRLPGPSGRDLPAFSLASGLPRHGGRDLPAECADFTAGLCNPNSDELMDFFPNLAPGPNTNALCQELCQAMEGCR